MVKPRLAIVISKPIVARGGLCTVVPLSTTAPDPVMPYHCALEVAFKMPSVWGNRKRWVKGDMVYAAGFHRIDLLSLGKDRSGKRIYQTSTISEQQLAIVQRCVLQGLGLGTLTKHL
ncbi:type II toxin-antitoxin system PemK/MazF family toxin [Oceanicola sp. D3]|uniref:type II toxin-antitoxin system PemK/MazF family toxin n=1 Tax=Oceanicola sp. D3 TaxID=2587163 RepID=UPI0020C7F9AA|nr:type II toxin-antitoxin system PemK/MazF family toxin [Oceanicola sp. D3]